MKKNRNTFIEFSLDYKVLQFGNFTLKSGRNSPYFFNIGLFHDGSALHTLGQFYAHLYHQHHLMTPHLFGPAYKGIILATMTAIALANKKQVCTVTFNRKENKDHGEKGQLIGAPLTGLTTIIDDVLTAGTAFDEAKTLIEAHHGQVHSLLIALDRCAYYHGALTSSHIQKQGIAVYSLITIWDIIDYLSTHQQQHQAQLIKDYQNYHEMTAIPGKK